MPAPSPLVMMQPRHSLDSRKAVMTHSCVSSSTLDLATLRVSVAELRLTSDGKWLYVLQLSTGSRRWELLRRYSELREFWTTLCARIGAAGECEEHVHFLEGLEGDKFPKKRLLHTKNALEARANDLDDCFLKLSMRLNLCSDRALAICHTRGCYVLALLADFLQIPSSGTSSPHMSSVATASTASSPLDIPQRARLAKYRSYPLTRGDRQRSKSSRRLSFAERRDSQVIAGPRSL